MRNKYGKRIITMMIVTMSISSSQGYFLGLKSWDNTIENIHWVEKKLNISLPIVSFIFDPRDETAIETIKKLPKELGRQKIYHITVSPRNSAKEVAEGKADEIYKSFFALVKELNIKVVFRTMHEMNGGWYPWASDPQSFIIARKRIRQLSRDINLSKEDILFDMSVNGRDIPTRDKVPHKGSVLFFCPPSQKVKLRCPTFEDYYPGDEYVDLMGFTFYNRGKGNTNRQWQDPYGIISHNQRHTLDRLKKIGKPMFVDEVGTTTVWYDEGYNAKRSQEVFEKESWRKDIWLDSLSAFLKNEPLIVGAIYFNVDLTYGLTNRQQGEADRAIFDPATGKMYEGGKRLLENATENNIMSTPLFNVFGIRRAVWGNKVIFLSKKYGKQALGLLTMLGINEKISYTGSQVSLDMYEKAIQDSKLSRSQKVSRGYIINEARKIISQ